MTSFIKIVPLSTEIWRCVKQVNGQKPDGHMNHRPAYVMPLATYCWRRKHWN